LDTIINFNLTPEDQEVHKTVDVLLVYSPDVEIKTTISAKKLDHDMTLLKVLVASKHELKPIEEDAKIYVVSSLVLSSNESRTVTTTDGRQIQTTSGDGPEQTIQTLIEF